MHAGLWLWAAPVLLALAAGSMFFSAIETSFFALQPFQIERLRKSRAEFAAALAKLMEHPRRLVSATLLVDSLLNLPLIVLCLFLLRRVLSPQLPFWVAALLTFTLVVFICDLVPKVVALAHPQRVVKAGVRVMRLMMPVADPLARLLLHASEMAADALTPAAFGKTNMLSEEEVETLVEVSAEEGALHPIESEIIQDIISLGDKSVRDCMVPRVDVFAVPDDLTNEELIPKLVERRRRRVPVYGETPDEMLGLLDVQAFLFSTSGQHYTDFLLPPSFVPETMNALDLLRGFTSRPQAFAIVTDEHGGTEGIITMADLVEEILSDAVPSADRELYIESVGEGRLIVDGGARLDDLNDMLGVHLEEEGIDTIAGLIFNRHGTLPRKGSEFSIGGLALTVRRVSKKRIEEVGIVDRRAEAREEEE